MYISKITLQDVRCFAELEIEFDLSGKTPGMNMIVGDNATGKTALLRSIAMGMCDESSAAGLMKESEEGYIRQGEEGAKITIDLIDKDHLGEINSTPDYRIITNIKKVSAGKISYERLRQETESVEEFPWDKIFVCAYGAARGTSGTGDIAGWSSVNAVYNLFNYDEGLQNAELTILRIDDEAVEDKVLKKLGGILHNVISAKRSGIQMTGPWGTEMPLRDVADGYRSSFLWITDFLGWALAYDPENFDPDQISGVVLIDEIEQHLHATWQRKIIHQLKEHFPKIQFILTTHSPLVASSIGSLSLTSDHLISEEGLNDLLIYLELQPGNKVTREYLPSMRYLRADQVLASRAFKYVIHDDPEVEKVLKELSILKEREDELKPDQRESFLAIRRELAKILLPGRTPIERDIELEQIEELRAILKELEEKFPSGVEDEPEKT
jgi:hypothetical protein